MLGKRTQLTRYLLAKWREGWEVWTSTISVAECDQELSAMEEISGLISQENRKASVSTCFTEVIASDLNAAASISKRSS